MFATIRKNQKWLLWVIISVIIVTFVIFFTPEANNMLGGATKVDYGSIEGKPVTEGEFEQGRIESGLVYRLSTGSWPGDAGARGPEFEVVTASLQRVALLKLIEQFDIHADDNAVVTWIRRNFTDADNTFNKGFYDQFLATNLKPRGIDEELFHEFIKHQVAIGELQNVMAASGSFYTQSEAKADFGRQFKSRTTEAVFLSTTNYLPQVKVDTNAVKLFFTNSIARYREPAKAQATYVTFPNSNYTAQAEAKLAEIEDLDKDLEAAYEARGTNSFFGDDGKPLSKEDAIAEIKSDEADRIAHLEARKAANDLLTKLYALQEEQKNLFETNLVSLAKEAGLTTQVTAPFDASLGPIEVDFSARNPFASSVFALSAGNAVSLEPVRGQSAVYVVALNKRIPSQTPKFETKAEQVTEDYKDSEANRLMREAGTKLYDQLTKATGEGKSFSDAAKEAGQTAITFPAIGQRDRTQADIAKYVSYQNYAGTAFQTDVGQVSRYATVGDTGYLVYVKEEAGPSEEQLAEELPDFIDMNRQSRESAAFNAKMSALLQAMVQAPVESE